MRHLLLITMLLSSTSIFAENRKHADRLNGSFGASHIFTFTPFSGIVAYGNINPGAGIDYEYVVSKKLRMGIHIPLMIGYIGPDQTDYYYGYNITQHSSIFTAPGIRFHTGSRYSHADFSTGPSILIGNMHFKTVSDNSWPQQPPYDYHMLGLILDNSLNFYRNHFVFGFNVKTGAMKDIHENSRYFIQFGMQFGGIF